MDNIVAIVETIRSLIHIMGKKGFLLLKLDLEKIYDPLKWPYLTLLFGHPKEIINHISLCFYFSSFSNELAYDNTQWWILRIYFEGAK